MKRFTFTAESSAADMGTWHTLGIPGDTTMVDIKSLTVSSRAGDVAADVGITLLDSAAAQSGSVRWKSGLRSAKEWGNYYPNIGMIKITNGGLQLHTDRGGTSVLMVVSCVYNCYNADEAARIV